MKDRESQILYFASLAVREMTESDPTKRDEISEEMRKIEYSLRISQEEILKEARNLVS